jgi:hypothetical protein
MSMTGISTAADLNRGLSEQEIAQLVSLGLVEIASARPDGSYPDNTRLWLTGRGRVVFGPMVDHARDVDFHLAAGEDA